MPQTPKIITPFPIHILDMKWEGTNQLCGALKQGIKKKQSEDPDGMYRSNQSGTWHSDLHLLRYPGQQFKVLGDMFYGMFSNYCDLHGGKEGGQYQIRMTAWAMVYGDRGYAAVHNHPNCHLSGVFYVDPGPEQEAVRSPTGVEVAPGSFEFVSPHQGAGMLMADGLSFSPGFRYSPVQGQMVIFPSWLPHYVHPCVGDHERISIACNASVNYIKPKE